MPSFTKIRTTFRTPVGSLSVEDYYHSVESWQGAVDRAGLVGLDIQDVLPPPPAAAGKLPPAFWDGYIKPQHPGGCAQTAVIRARKGFASVVAGAATAAPAAH